MLCRFLQGQTFSVNNVELISGYGMSPLHTRRYYTTWTYALTLIKAVIRLPYRFYTTSLHHYKMAGELWSSLLLTAHLQALGHENVARMDAREVLHINGRVTTAPATDKGKHEPREVRFTH
jgi:hypothetical protein